MKRFMILALVAVLAFGVVGVATTPVKGQGLKIGLVTDVGQVDDRSFNQSAYEGVVKAAEAIDGEFDYIETKDPNDYAANIAAFADQDYDIIVTVGFALGEATAAAAAKYPDIHFIGVDQFQGAEIANVTGLIFPEAKAGFLAGVLAARLSKSGTIAAVLGTDQVPPVVAFKEGYEAGAKFANPGIKLISTYHPGGLDKAFTDPEWGATTAKQALDNGADVVFGAGGKTGNGALEEVAKEATAGKEVYCIGVDTDQWETVPAAHSCLVSSAMKLITDGVVDIVALIAEGEAPSGNFIGKVGLADFHDFTEKLPKELIDELAALKTALDEDMIDPLTGMPMMEATPEATKAP
ncbi:MAG TPA: BMP family ABC transporter substrate-binding protein [Aggregatilineales bacterium]|nr:BMP family ABC transporter substrate-binding protein [Anaerolineales bacterium]HRE48599.1 BMP family ABC transporter substrate-binding protein [Aggregatilineales bacterium]